MIIQPIENVYVVNLETLLYEMQKLTEDGQHLAELAEVITTALFWQVAIMGFLLGLTVMILFAIAWRKV